MSDDKKTTNDSTDDAVSARASASDRLAQVQRQQRRSGRRGAVIGSVAAVLTIVLIAGGGWWLIKRDTAQPTAAEIGKVKTYSNLSRDHITSGYKYAQEPPAGGAHNAAWANCGVYTKTIPPQYAVHSLEHGAVWITYKSDVPAAQRNALAAKANKQQGYMLMSPNDKQAAPIMLTAWGAQLAVDSPTDKAVDEFIKKYWQGAQTPEPGASCDGAFDPNTGKVAGQM